MVLGIGCDIIEIGRVEAAINKEGFLKKYFTENEIDMINLKGAKTAAGNFAAKEAVAKALGTGFYDFFPIHIEVLRDNKGMPVVSLHGNAKKLAEEMGISQVLISISHSKEYAVAYAVALSATNV